MQRHSTYSIKPMASQKMYRIYEDAPHPNIDKPIRIFVLNAYRRVDCCGGELIPRMFKYIRFVWKILIASLFCFVFKVIYGIYCWRPQTLELDCLKIFEQPGSLYVNPQKQSLDFSRVIPNFDKQFQLIRMFR